MIDRVLTVRGARGSMAVSGKEYLRYGGNTTSFDIEVAPRHRLIVDCGTGLRNLQHAADFSEPHEFTVFFSHFHWDHVQGLPLFAPLFDERHRFTFYGMPREGMGVADLLHGGFRAPWWPITVHDAHATTWFRELSGPVEVGGLTVSPVGLHHPQGCTGYRIDGDRRSIVIATDHEAGDRRIDKRLIDLANGADVLIHDGQYTTEEYPSRVGFGHSTWKTAAETAREAEVSRLVLTSHDPERYDDAVDQQVRLSRTIFPMSAGAHEGMTIRL